MRFIRYKQAWHAIETFSGMTCCLEEIAFRHGYNVAGVCDALGCSERYLYAAFIRDIGLSPKTWMNLERMVVARRKLEGGKTIEETADDLGFKSVEAFGRAFYHMFRVSPVRYLKSRIIFDPMKPLPPYWMIQSATSKELVLAGEEE